MLDIRTDSADDAPSAIDNVYAAVDLGSNSFHMVISKYQHCLLYTSPSPRDKRQSRMPSSA